MHTVFVCSCVDTVCSITDSLAVESFSPYTIVCKFFQFEYVLAKATGFHFYWAVNASALATTVRQFVVEQSVSQNNSSSVFDRQRIPSNSNACGANAKSCEVLRRSIRS